MSKIKINPAHKGAFTRKASAAGKSVSAYANQVMANPDKYPDSTVKQANFAKNARGWNKGGK